MVDAHLATCSRCLEETEVAATARSALASLPRLEGPGLAALGLAALLGPDQGAGVASAARAAGDDPRPLPDTAWSAGRRARPARARPARRWNRVAVGAGVAAVAAAVVAFSVYGLRNSSTRGAAGPALGAAPSATGAPSLPPLLEGASDYTPTSLGALAQALAPLARTAPLPGAARNALSPAFSGSGPTVATLPPAEGRAALACLERGGAPAENPFYLESSTFQGTPAYIGAFAQVGSSGSAGHVVVVAVGSDGCRLLFEARQTF